MTVTIPTKLSDDVYRRLIPIADAKGVQVGQLLSMLAHSAAVPARSVKTRRFTADEDAVLRRLHQDGQTDRVIARALRRPESSITHRRNLLGLPGGPTGRRKVFTPEQGEGILRRYLSGDSVKDLATEHQVSQNAVRNALKEARS